MFKKMIAAVLSTAMLLSCAMLSGAASGPDVSVDANGDVIYEYEDFIIVVSDTPVKQTRASDPYLDIQNGVAYAPSGKKINFDLGDSSTSNEGYTQAIFEVINTDDSDSLDCTFSGFLSGSRVQSIKVEDMQPGQSKTVTYKSTNGKALYGTITTAIVPTDSNSVSYEYSVAAR